MVTDIPPKLAYQAQLFSNRLAKRHRALRRWARKNRVSCYRLYDRDIPEVPLAADLYEFLPDGIADKAEAARFLREEERRVAANDPSAAGDIALRQYLHLYMYERPFETDGAAERAWLGTMASAAARTLGIAESHVIVKTRRRQRGDSQYEKTADGRALTGTVQECGQLFTVNLSDYLDTGLFFDHRPLRALVRETAAGRSVLNLFCYTGSFSVYAAEGGARRVESVDLSNTYLAWARRNMALNGFSGAEKYAFTRSDVTAFLREQGARRPDGTNRYDIIILDPPTFSNSKSTRGTLDVNRDWPALVGGCLALLNPRGTLYFSTNSRRLAFDPARIPQADGGAPVAVTDMTERSLPEDFRGTKSRRCWMLRPAT